MTAATVPEAMRALATTSPNLLITEIRLDSYNGLHLIAMAPKPIPAIVITGFADRAVEADARRLGAEYLAKPVSPGELYATVQRTLSNAASRGVFMPPRADPRTDVAPNTMVIVNDSPACLLDVSAGGARIEIQCAPGATVQSPLAFRHRGAGRGAAARGHVEAPYQRQYLGLRRGRGRRSPARMAGVSERRAQVTVPA